MTGEERGSASVEDRLRSPSAERRLEAMTELAARASPPTDEQLDALVACLDDDRKLVQRRAAESLATLRQRGADVQGRVRRLLPGGELRRRWGSVYALSLMDALEVDAIDTLVESLDLADRDLRWAALDLLKKLAGRQRNAVVERAIAVGVGASPVQRRMAFYLLRDLAAGEPAARQAAVDALATDDSNLRLAALAALAAAGAESSEDMDRLAALVDDPDLRIARAAAATLGSLRTPSPRVLETLRAARLHADSSLRRAAESALRRLGEQGGAE